MPVVLVALPEVIIAAMALLIILGGLVLVEFIGRSINAGFSIPGLSFVINWVQSATNTALNAMAGWLDSLVKGVTSAITAIPNAIANIVGAIEAFAWAHWSWLHALITQTIPSLWNTLWQQVSAIYQYFNGYISQIYNTLTSFALNIERYLIGLVNTVESYLLSYIASTATYLSRLISDGLAAASAYALSLYNSAISFVDKIFGQLEAYVVSEIARVEAYAVSLANWAIQQAVNIAEQYAKQYADWAIQQLLNALTFGTTILLAPAWPRIIDAIDAIARAIPGTLEGVLEDIRAIPRSIPASLPAIIAALLGVIAVAIEYVARCGVDICKNLHGFGDEVASLSDEILTAGMIAFVIAAIEAPEETARETDAIAIEPIVEVGKGFANLVGTVF
jgi:hypothetical protein